jgi:ribosome biogenesis GTPase
LKKGIVIKSTGSWYTVKAEDGSKTECKIKGNFRIKGIKSTNPIAVGDIVEFKLTENKKEHSEEPVGLITHIQERKTTLSGGLRTFRNSHISLQPTSTRLF